MKNIIRLTVGVNKVNVSNPQDCYLEISDLLENSDLHSSDIVLLPRLALSSPSSGAILKTSLIAEECKRILKELIKSTESHNGYLIVGLVVSDLNRPVSATAVLSSGELVALLPNQNSPEPFISSGFSDEFSGTHSAFAAGNMRFQVHCSDFSTLSLAASEASRGGCDLYLVPTYEPMVAGKIGDIKALCKSLSASLGMAIAVVNGGIGDSSTPYLFDGFLAVYEAGKELAFGQDYSRNISATVDLDLDIIRAGKTDYQQQVLSPICHSILPSLKQGKLLRKIEKNPFLPTNELEKEAYLKQLFEYQIQSLVARMGNTGIDKLVLGVSGGIDSTAALLVSVAACDFLGLPRENILGVTLPGLGTSELTYFNALALMEQLGISRRDISIRPSVLQHFTDIGHGGEHDTAFENAQARERTQVLLDLANMVGGLVVGSGDLSEEALGFSTFGGDHLANYNVNCCMTKTMLRELLAFLVKYQKYPEISSVLEEVLETPVSPELLPTTESGDISQKTEEILGPYELHEFFLYHFIGYSMTPAKIYAYACQAFLGYLGEVFIKEKLSLFIKKFCANQFKRSCAPDGASITSVNLLGVNYQIPSDLDPTLLLDDLSTSKSLL